MHVDTHVCVGFGICIGIDPEVFALHDNGYAIVLVDDVNPSNEDAVRAAARQCPAQAIFISNDSAV